MAGFTATSFCATWRGLSQRFLRLFCLQIVTHEIERAFSRRNYKSDACQATKVMLQWFKVESNVIYIQLSGDEGG
jgi:hypothetical protein